MRWPRVDRRRDRPGHAAAEQALHAARVRLAELGAEDGVGDPAGDRADRPAGRRLDQPHRLHERAIVELARSGARATITGAAAAARGEVAAGSGTGAAASGAGVGTVVTVIGSGAACGSGAARERESGGTGVGAASVAAAPWRRPPMATVPRRAAAARRARRGRAGRPAARSRRRGSQGRWRRANRSRTCLRRPRARSRAARAPAGRLDAQCDGRARRAVDAEAQRHAGSEFGDLLDVDAVDPRVRVSGAVRDGHPDRDRSGESDRHQEARKDTLSPPPTRCTAALGTWARVQHAVRRIHDERLAGVGGAFCARTRALRKTTFVRKVDGTREVPQAGGMPTQRWSSRRALLAGAPDRLQHADAVAFRHGECPRGDAVLTLRATRRKAPMTSPSRALRAPLLAFALAGLGAVASRADGDARAAERGSAHAYIAATADDDPIVASRSSACPEPTAGSPQAERSGTRGDDRPPAKAGSAGARAWIERGGGRLGLVDANNVRLLRVARRLRTSGSSWLRLRRPQELRAGRRCTWWPHSTSDPASPRWSAARAGGTSSILDRAWDDLVARLEQGSAFIVAGQALVTRARQAPRPRSAGQQPRRRYPISFVGPLSEAAAAQMDGAPGDAGALVGGARRGCSRRWPKSAWCFDARAAFVARGTTRSARPHTSGCCARKCSSPSMPPRSSNTGRSLLAHGWLEEAWLTALSRKLQAPVRPGERRRPRAGRAGAGRLLPRPDRRAHELRDSSTRSSPCRPGSARCRCSRRRHSCSRSGSAPR